jgi:hypothetical protein
MFIVTDRKHFPAALPVLAAGEQPMHERPVSGNIGRSPPQRPIDSASNLFSRPFWRIFMINERWFLRDFALPQRRRISRITQGLRYISQGKPVSCETNTRTAASFVLTAASHACRILSPTRAARQSRISPERGPGWRFSGPRRSQPPSPAPTDSAGCGRSPAAGR